MKTSKILIAIAAFSLFACGENKTNEEAEAQPADYKGSVTVLMKSQESGTDQEQVIENVEVNFDPSEDGKTASIIMYSISFAPNMPPLDITIPNLSLSHTKTGFKLSCDRVVPLALGGEFPMYTVTEFVGSVNEEELEFKLNFGQYPTSFSGQKNIAL